MKPDKKDQKEHGCAGCQQCLQCSEVNYEEKRIALPEMRTSSELYAAEAQNYYFYFTPGHDALFR